MIGSVLGLDCIDMIHLFEPLLILRRAYQHHLCEAVVRLVLKAGDLFTGAYGAAYHSVLFVGVKRTDLEPLLCTTKSSQPLG